jgi:hypothetical protein
LNPQSLSDLVFGCHQIQIRLDLLFKFSDPRLFVLVWLLRALFPLVFVLQSLEHFLDTHLSSCLAQASGKQSNFFDFDLEVLQSYFLELVPWARRNSLTQTGHLAYLDISSQIISISQSNPNSHHSLLSKLVSAQLPLSFMSHQNGAFSHLPEYVHHNGHSNPSLT